MGRRFDFPEWWVNANIAPWTLLVASAALDPLEGLPGAVPPAPPWGQCPVSPNDELKRRILPEAGANREIVVVLGAGGAFAPDLLNALLLRGTGAVVGVDVQLTYPVAGAGYRCVDLGDGRAVAAFFRQVRAFAAERGLVLGTTYDLSTVQTSPARGADRSALSRGKDALLAALRETTGDVRLFYMSTAEVYGAPPGAPYGENHTKAPCNDYGRAKWASERQVFAAHGSRSAGGRLLCSALRCWTICMVNVDDSGRVVEARNYNDPIIAVAERLARAGIRIPVVDSELRAQFHVSEEVAEVCVLLGSAPPDAPTWGKSFNCTGRAATHGRIRDICYGVFEQGSGPSPWWSLPARVVLGGRNLPGPLVALAAQGLEAAGGLLGARDLGARLPFLYRSTDIDSTALRTALRGRLTEPEGSSSEQAVQRLAQGIRNGGPGALSFRRYHLY